MKSRSSPNESATPLRAPVARLLELANDAIFVRDLEGKLLYWNRGAERLYQWSQDEALGRNSEDILRTRFSIDREAVLAEFQRTGTWSGELEHQRRDGTWVAVSSRWILEQAGGEGQAAILQINTDISERRRAERALQESEARFRGLLEAAPDAIVVTRRDGGIAFSNRRTADMFGYTADELKSQEVERLMPERFRGTHVRHREKFSANPQRREMGAGLDLVAIRKDGSEFPVEISLSPLHVGEELLVMAAIRDITRRKHTEAELQRLHNLELAQSEHLATLGEVAAGLAHEIKNPLAGIAAALDVLKPQLAQSGDAGVMEEVQLQVRRIRAIVDDLLHYARPRPLEPRLGDLNAAITPVVQLVARQASPKGVSVEMLAGDLPLVMHDPDFVQRMVLNLMLNALDAVPERTGRIEVSTRTAAGAAQIEVRDNGTGIAPQDQEKVFRPFYTTKAGGGTGLGLPLCRRIAELHRGTLTVASEAGRGTAFTATLPAPVVEVA